MFRLMAGIPPDPRICPDNLTFEVDVDDIIERYSRNCGHDASMMTCGSCGIHDIMVGKELLELPLLHKRILLLECSQEKLSSLSSERRKSMHLVTIDGKTYHLDSAAVNTEKKTVVICRNCYISLAYALTTKKPPCRRLPSMIME